MATKDDGKGAPKAQGDVSAINGVFRPNGGWVVVAFISPVGLDVGQLAAQTLGQNSRGARIASLAPAILRKRLAVDREKQEESLAAAGQVPRGYKRPTAPSRPRVKK